MFGSLRFVLAIGVVLMHLSTYTVTIGYWAVLSFYVLSGYLITLVLRTSYGYTYQGLRRFALNRFLRIFPPYWIAVLFSISIIVLFPALAIDMNQGLSLPDSLNEFALNAAIFGHIPPSGVSRPIPPVWTLHVELVFYCLMALALTKTDKRIVIWLLAGVGITIAINITSFSQNDFVQKGYFSTLAGSLPFSIGAFAFIVRSRLEHRIPKLSNAGFSVYLTIVATPAVGLLVASNIYDSIPSDILFRTLYYLVLVLAGCGVLFLSLAKSSREKINALDKRLGAFSYPIYLVHWPVAVLVTGIAAMLGISVVRGNILFGAGLIGSLLVAECLRRFVDVPIEKLRKSIKHKNRVEGE
jgi:peptidoglycan/LPS O-acetylase OafA/YrhL